MPYESSAPFAAELAKTEESKTFGLACEVILRISRLCVDHPVASLRKQLYELVAGILDVSDDNDMQFKLRRILFRGLDDASFDCRSSVLEAAHRALPRNAWNRLSQLFKLALPDAGSGTRWVESAAALMMRLSMDEKDAAAPLHGGIAGATFEIVDLGAFSADLVTSGH